MKKTVYERDDVRVVVAVDDMGRTGSAYVEVKTDKWEWMYARSFYTDSGIFPKGYSFHVPGGRWPWNRSLQRAVFLAIDEAQRHAEYILRARQEVEVVCETLDAIVEALP
jgi:hypothetical protein